MIRALSCIWKTSIRLFETSLDQAVGKFALRTGEICMAHTRPCLTIMAVLLPWDSEKEQALCNLNLQRKSLPVYTFDEFHSETDVLSKVLLFRGYFLFEISRIENSFCLKRNWHYHDSDKDERLEDENFLFLRIHFCHVTFISGTFQKTFLPRRIFKIWALERHRL